MRAGVLTTAAGATGVLVGGLAGAGWALDVSFLKSLLPGAVTMKPNTALGFILAGVAVWLLGRAGVGRRGRLLGLVCAGAVVLIGVLTLGEYVGGLNLRIDELLFRDAQDAVGTFLPGRMAPTSAFCFLAVGAALLLVGRRRGEWLVQALALTVLSICSLALLGYLYGVEALYGPSLYTRMAVHTALAFFVLGLGLLSTVPNRGLMALLSSRGVAGHMARRLLPATLIVPALLGWLRLLGQRAGLYGMEFGLSVYVVGTIAALSALVWCCAASIERMDARRERVEAELGRSEKRLRDILSHTPAVVFMKDLEGRYLLVNRRFEDLFHVKESGILGKTDHDVFPREMADVFRANDRKVLADGAPLEVEEVAPHDEGPHTFLSVKCPLSDAGGVPYAVCGIATDITDRKRADEELRRAKDVAEAANKELEAFSYSVSHDLRAPLRSIDGFTQALVEDCGPALGETGTRHLQRVRDATQRMGRLIDDLLNLSRLTRAELRRESVDLSGMARSIAADLQAGDPQRRADFRIADDAGVTGDIRLLRVALENLLGNAWKFTRNRDAACIEFGAARRNGDRIFFVRDNGAGFDMTYAAKLFGAFQRLHTTREFEGTGIGLATVARIIGRHGGRVWAEGAPDRGATFYFTL